MLNKLRKVFHELDRRGVRYCHWKSNFAFRSGASGDTDIDILVDRRNQAALHTSLVALGFRPVVSLDGEAFPSVQHYYGLDEDTGKLVDLHIYFQTITGQSLLKGYRLPIEELLLSNSHQEDGVRMPVKAAELILFTLRMSCKYASLLELLLLARKWREHQKEAKWLLAGSSRSDTIGLLARWLPALDRKLFWDCMTALTTPASIVRRVLVARRMRRHLRPYARYSGMQAPILEAWTFLRLSLQRLRPRARRKSLCTGGAVVAFVGADRVLRARSVRAIERWLGEEFAVWPIAATVSEPVRSDAKTTGSSTVGGAVKPSNGSRRAHRNGSTGKARDMRSLRGAIRAACGQYQRYMRLRKAYRRAANGGVVLCDGLPSEVADLPNMKASHKTAYGIARVIGLLSEFTERLYKRLPEPDLVVRVDEPGNAREQNVLAYHLQESSLAGQRTPSRISNLATCATLVSGQQDHAVATDESFEQAILRMKRILWESL